jgi:ferrous iron transport protein B
MSAAAATMRLALVGNPNCGKTALFNLLTGSRQKVANYAGVTVERKEGRMASPGGRQFVLLDLPGAYSFHAASLDEAVTRDICRGFYPGEPAPDALVCVVDATNLRLHLRFALEVIALGKPVVVAVNMMDAARRRGIGIDLPALQRELGVPVVETVAVRRDGARALVAQLEAMAAHPSSPQPARSVRAGNGNTDRDNTGHRHHIPLDHAPGAEALHTETRRLLDLAVTMPRRTARIDDTLDRWLLHPVVGLLSLAVVMFLMFQAVYAWATPFMDAIDAASVWLGEAAGARLADGPLKSLLVDGVIAGLGGVIIFLPQILILFAFILALEESGYLPRAAFLLDRMMFKAGLSGRSFIPLLSSFACAVPGIMATRSIEDEKDRLTTILIAPLMTCSARLPVYTIIIGAFIPDRQVAPFIGLQGLVLLGLYLMGIVGAFVAALVLRKTVTKGHSSGFMLEMPKYQWPRFQDVAIGLWQRAWVFLKRAGTIIAVTTIVLWLLLSFPRAPEGQSQVDHSIAGRIAGGIEVVVAPIGFNRDIALALIPAMAAREVAVSAIGTVYAVDDAEGEAGQKTITQNLQNRWSLPTALAFLMWFVFAPQCISTIAVTRRETNGWKWPLFMVGYLFAAAYFMAGITYWLAVAAGL